MEVSGSAMLAVLGALAVLLALGWLWGRRTNLGVAKAYAAALEAVFEPLEREYVWIGGLIGFHATYQLAAGRWVKISLVMPPRQSPLYLPFSLLVFGRERLFISVSVRRLKGRAELVGPGASSRTRRVHTDQVGWADSRPLVLQSGRELMLHSQRHELRNAVQGFVEQAGPAAERLAHLSLDLEPDPRVYLFMRPRRPSDVTGIKDALETLVERVDAKVGKRPRKSVRK